MCVCGNIHQIFNINYDYAEMLWFLCRPSSCPDWSSKRKHLNPISGGKTKKVSPRTAVSDWLEDLHQQIGGSSSWQVASIVARCIFMRGSSIKTFRHRMLPSEKIVEILWQICKSAVFFELFNNILILAELLLTGTNYLDWEISF